MRFKRSDWMASLALVCSMCTLIGMLYIASPLVFGATRQQSDSDSTLLQPDQVIAISNSFNYQGILRNSEGQLLTGVYTITLRVYSTVTGGLPLFTQTTSDVNVNDGVFNVALGNSPGNPLGATAFANSPRYLGIAITPDVEMTPRQEIHAVPWALMANSATTLQPGSVINGNLSIASGGKIGVGTQNPAYSVDVKGDVALSNHLIVAGQRVLRTDETGIVVGDLQSDDGSRSLFLRAGDADRMSIYSSGVIRANGNMEVQGELKAYALRDIGDSAGGASQRSAYENNLSRYVIEAPDKSNTPTSVALDNAMVEQLCRDVDGCSIRLGMRSAGSGTMAGTLAMTDTWLFSLSDTTSNVRQWYVRSSTSFATGLDNDNQEETVLKVWDCLFTDFKIVGGAAQSDTDMDFWITNWYGSDNGAYNNPEMVCLLIIDD